MSGQIGIQSDKLQGISSGFVLMSGAGLNDFFNISTKILCPVAS